MVELYDRSEIVSILQGYNPWWSGREHSVPSFQRIAYHVCLDHLKNPESRRAILLSGPRRVGKSTILNQIAATLKDEVDDPRSICYISLDHPLLKLLTLPRILEIYHADFHSVGKPTILLLDEVQYSADWDLHIKQLIDHSPEYRILATGSASVTHRQRLAESGVGRWMNVQIPTLSFYEFLRIRGEEAPSIPDDLRPSDLFRLDEADLRFVAESCRAMMPLFQRYLLVGGFPEMARISDNALCQRLLREDVVERVLKRDMAALFGIRNVNDLEKLFIYICLNSGGIFSVTGCARDLGVSKNTVQSHLDALEQANLIYRLPQFALTGKKVLRARHKVYLVDAALRNAVLLRDESILSDPNEMGTIVETTVLRHLYAYHYVDTPQISYYRDSQTQKEVDIIVKSPAYTIPTEVKYRENAKLSESDGLVELCRAEGVDYAYWVTKREADFDVRSFDGTKAKFLRVPAHIFVYLLGQAERLLWTPSKPSTTPPPPIR